MGTVPPPTFTGSSKYAADFQQVLGRAVSIASLPLQQMQNELNTMTAQQSDLQGLQTDFNSLQTALQNVDTANQGTLGATVSNPSVVSASATSSALPGTYTIQVDSLGSNTTTLSNSGLTTVTDPTSGNISSATSFTLTINGTNTTITPSGTSLLDLANAIDSAGLNVQATIVNVGSNSSPDYRLAVTSTNLAADTVQLNDGTNNLLTTLSTGAAATYQVQGQSTQIQSNSTQVTLAPGLTVNLLEAAPSSPVTITVARNFNTLSSALTNFTNAYNTVVDDLAKQHGQNAGSLSGDSILSSLSQTLQSISTYTNGTGAVSSVTNLGLNLDSTGHLSFDSSVLSGQSTSAIQQFLGGISSSGFLQAANTSLNGITDPSTGVLQNSLLSTQDEINNENQLIADQTTRITDLETNLQKQLAAADANIAVLQNQVTYMTSLFSTMYPNTAAANTINGSSSSIA